MHNNVNRISWLAIQSVWSNGVPRTNCSLSSLILLIIIIHLYCLPAHLLLTSTRLGRWLAAGSSPRINWTETTTNGIIEWRVRRRLNDTDRMDQESCYTDLSPHFERCLWACGDFSQAPLWPCDGSGPPQLVIVLAVGFATKWHSLIDIWRWLIEGVVNQD